MKQKGFLKLLCLRLLVVALLIQTFPETLVIIDYMLDTSRFAALCINKDKPEMHCDGSCQMEEMLKHVHQDDDKNTHRHIEYHTSVYFIKEIISVKKIVLDIIQSNPLGGLPHFKKNLFENSIFKPPRLIA